MIIKGLQKNTMLDYPGKIACIVFTAGCNFRCPYCHNPDLIEGFEKFPTLDEEDFFAFLDERKKWLDAVVICGGEPTISKDLPEFMKRIKDKGFFVKLDTNGTNPDMIQQVIDGGTVDYIAMDVKAPKEKYGKIVRRPVDIDKLSKSIDIIKKAGLQNRIDYEFRTTVVPGITDAADIIKMAEWISGAKKYVIQQFRNMVVLDPALEQTEPYLSSQLEEFKKTAEQHVASVEVKMS